jgi:hypothetical protein
VDNAATADFPFVQELPKRERSKLATLWDLLNEARVATQEHGTPIPVGFAAELLGVSKQRVSQLLDQGKLTTVMLNDQRFVGENSLVAWAKSERIVGRPPSLKTCIANAREMVAQK